MQKMNFFSQLPVKYKIREIGMLLKRNFWGFQLKQKITTIYTELYNAKWFYITYKMAAG